MRIHRSVILVIAILVPVFGAMDAGLTGAAGIHAAITPALTVVEPGDFFAVDFAITAADASFNGFDAVVEYDPAAVTFLPTSPTALQQGMLMTGACGSTFHRFSAAADSMAFTSVILCSGISRTGPGQLYHLNFQAGPALTETWIRLRPTRERFYNAGIRVSPVETADGLVKIVDLTGVGDANLTRGLSLRAAPNPVREGTTFELWADEGGAQSLAIYDLRGRVVRALDASDAGAGARTVAWDGRDDRGLRLAPGVYRAVLRAGGRRVSEPVVILP